jgi:hypothetical protein
MKTNIKDITFDLKIFATFSLSKSIKHKSNTMLNLISSIVVIKEDYNINIENLVDRLKILECKEICLYYITPFGTPFHKPVTENKLFYRPKKLFLRSS